MKKLFAILMAAFMCFSIFALSAVAEETDTNPILEICKAKTAPVVDGVVSKGEYNLIASYADGTIVRNLESEKNPVAELYAAWDDEYFYYAVRVTCYEPHSAPHDDASEHWIFNGHHLMCCLIPEDPYQDKYKAANGEYWEWGPLYNAGLCHEWTTILNSETGKVETANHFLNITGSAGFQTEVKSENGFDTYEARIAFSQINTRMAEKEFTAEEGSIFGFDFTIGLTDIGTGYDFTDGACRGDYLYLGKMYPDHRGKRPYTCARMVLSDTPVSEPTPDTSVPDTSAPDTSVPSTGDNGYVGYIVLAVAAAAVLFTIVTVRSKKRA